MLFFDKKLDDMKKKYYLCHIEAENWFYNLFKFKVMKKLLFLLAFAGISMTSFAQDAVPVQQYSVATNSFWSNWFIQVAADWNAYYSDQEHGNGYSSSPFKGFRSNPGASIAIGKWFTPGIGLRTKVQGIWGKTVDVDGNEDTSDGNGNKYWIANEQVLFNLSNLLCGYSETRVWNLIPFVGVGIGRSMTYDEYAIGLSTGIQSSWRLSRKVRFYAEIGFNFFDGNLDGTDACRSACIWDSHDNNVYGELGFTFNLGSATWKAVPDVDALLAQHQAELDALNAKLNDANSENQRLKNLLANQKPVEKGPSIGAEPSKIPVSVLFNINESEIASEKDLVNVQVLADYAKSHNLKMVVTGYADSETGSEEYNQKLSEDRASTVAAELEKLGVDSSKIVTKANGGVDDLSPVDFNRRATVQVTE